MALWVKRGSVSKWKQAKIMNKSVKKSESVVSKCQIDQFIIVKSSGALLFYRYSSSINSHLPLLILLDFPIALWVKLGTVGEMK